MHADKLQRIANDGTEGQFRHALHEYIEDQVTLVWLRGIVAASAGRPTSKQVAERNRTCMGLYAACVHEWGKDPEKTWFKVLCRVVGMDARRFAILWRNCRKADLDTLEPVTREYLYWCISQMGTVRYDFD